MHRAIAMRVVSNECVQWRSGRQDVRSGMNKPRSGGGKMPHTFGNDERVAAEGNGDVMVPAAEAAAFEVIEAEFFLEFLVGAFGAVALLQQANELLMTCCLR